ncbi:MAG: FKBP-type peptidyl-prolyl cis-trans isomerase [Patescibacteria group bacterium]
MAKTHERVFALVAAVLFFATTVAVSVIVVLQVRQQNKANKADITQTKQPQETKLQGTKLVGFTPIEKVDKLESIDLEQGTGDEVKPGDKVTAHYTGAIAKDGTIFQSSLDTGQPVPFSLNGVIKGWTEGVPGMKVGGKRRLLIPAALAYGSTPPQGSGIPADADLVFDIEMVKVGE